jgi:hypothetical protein
MPEADIARITSHQVPALCQTHEHENGEKEGEKEKRGLDKREAEQSDDDQNRHSFPKPILSLIQGYLLFHDVSASLFPTSSYHKFDDLFTAKSQRAQRINLLLIRPGDDGRIKPAFLFPQNSERSFCVTGQGLLPWRRSLRRSKKYALCSAAFASPRWKVPLTGEESLRFK